MLITKKQVKEQKAKTVDNSFFESDVATTTVDESFFSDTPPVEKKNLGGNDFTQNYLDPTIGLKNTTPLPSKAQSKLPESKPTVKELPVDNPLNPLYGLDLEKSVVVETADKKAFKINTEFVPKDYIVPTTKSVVSQSFSADVISQRVANKTATDADFEVLQKSNPNYSIDELKAYVLEDKFAGADKRMKNFVEQNNTKFGFGDVPEDVVSSKEKTAAYVSKIKEIQDELIKQKTQIEVKKILADPKMEDRDVDAFVIHTLATERAKKEVGDITEFYADYKKEFNDHRVTLIVNDKGLSKEQKVREISNVINPTEEKNYQEAKSDLAQRDKINPFTVGTGLSAIKRLYEKITNDDQKTNDVLNVTSFNAELVLQEKLNDIGQTLVNKFENEQDPTKKEEIRQQAILLQKDIVDRKDLILKYPAGGEQLLLKGINDFKLSRDSNVEGVDEDINFTKDEKKEALSYVKSNGLDTKLTYQGVRNVEDATATYFYLKENGYLNDPKLKTASFNILRKVANGDIDLQDPSLFSEAVQNFTGVFTNAAKSVGTAIGLRDKADIAEEKINDKYFSNVVDNDKLKWGIGFGRNLVNTTAQVVGQAVLQRATMGIGTELGVSKKIAEKVAFWSSGALGTYNDSYKIGMDIIDNESGRQIFAIFNAGVAAASEGIFPEAKIFDNIPGVKAGFSEIAKRFSAGTLTEETYKQLMRTTKDAFVNYAEKTTINVGKETFEEVFTKGAELGSRVIAGDKSVTWESAIKDLKETAYQTATGTLLVGALGARSDVKREQNAPILYQAAMYHDESKDAVLKGFNDGKFSEAEKDRQIQTINTAVSALAYTKDAEKLYNVTLSENDRVNLVANITTSKLLEQQKENTKDKGDIKQIDDKIADLEKQRNKILKQKPATNEIQSTESTQSTETENKTATGENAQSKGAENTVAQNINSFTPQEQEAVNVINTIDFNTEDGKRVKIWTDLIQDENAPIADKKQALKDLSEQLADPNSEIPTGLGLGKATDAIYNLIQPTVESAVIEINGKTYEGDNHAQAILNAKAAGEDISQVNRQADGKFKLSDGTIIDRATAKQRFGEDKSELLITQNEAADKANADYGNPQQPPTVSKVVGEVETVYHHTKVSPQDFDFGNFQRGKNQISQFGDGLAASTETTPFLQKRYGEPIKGEVKKGDFIEIDANKSEKEIYEELVAKGYKFTNPVHGKYIGKGASEEYNDTDKANENPAIITLFNDFQKSNPEVKGVKVLNHIIGNEKIKPFYVIYDNKSFYGEGTAKTKPTEPKQSKVEQTTPVSKVVGEVGNSVGGDKSALEDVEKTIQEKWDERVSTIDTEKEYTDLAELKEGDVILTKNGGLGFVKKISPKNVTYETTYKVNGETEIMELKTSKDDIRVFKKPKSESLLKEQPTETIQSKVVEGKAVEEIENTYKEEVHNEGAKIGELTLEKIPTEKIVESDNPRGNRERHTEIMKRLSKINKLIKCK